MSAVSAALEPTPAWQSRYMEARACTVALCAPLQIEDYGLQSMPEASPAKWHLAHTTWFFETFVLERYVPSYRPHNPAFRALYNSYYDSIGPQPARSERGIMSRPTVAEVYEYRAAVDDAMLALMGDCEPETAARIELGIQHERQHQELLLADLQHALAKNPLQPVYQPLPVSTGNRGVDSTLPYEHFAGGVVAIGESGQQFSFDSERPLHEVLLRPFTLAPRYVTQGEYLAFMEDKGYRRPELWLADGFAYVSSNSIDAPHYWFRSDDSWRRYSLHGPVPIDPNQPVCHVSYYEADAFARWARARLPTEFEWEAVHRNRPTRGHFLEDGEFIPRMSNSGFGSVWTWTSSPYIAYPGFRPESGELGEYNGKFMVNQWVLRGGSCFTPGESVRPTYRNFFPPTARWQATGIRLARDAAEVSG